MQVESSKQEWRSSTETIEEPWKLAELTRKSDAEQDGTPLLVTPLRFGIVQPKLFRGLYPRKLNLPFLRRLKLKTILSLTPEPLIDEIKQFCKEEGIDVIHIKTSKSKKKDVPLTHKEITQAIEVFPSIITIFTPYFTNYSVRL